MQINELLGTLVDRLSGDTVPIVATDSGVGSANAAQLDLGQIRKDVDVFVDASGAATLTVEARTDGGTWRTFDTVDYGAAGDTPSMEQYNVAYEEVRAYLDANRNAVEIASKGMD